MMPELIGWLVAFIVLSIVEAFSFQLVSIWFACGCVAAFIAALCGAEFWLQLTLFVAVSVILLAATRPLAKKLLKRKPIPTNVDSLIGKQGVVIEAIDNVAGSGRIHVDGLDWSARSADGNKLDEGAVVEVEAVEGVKAVVKPTKAGE